MLLVTFTIVQDEELRKKTVLEASVEDAGFSVKFTDGEMTCFITLTSIALVPPEENGKFI